MARVRDNAGYIGIKYSANATYQSGIWSIVEHERYAIGNPTFWNHSVLALDLLVVGGGGAGGYGRGAVRAGAGGGGGVVYKQNVQIANNTTYTIVVGAATSRTTSSGAQAGGNDSYINGTFYGYTNNSIVGIGGGYGGAPVQCQNGNRPGGAGGSGGGGAACGGGAGGAALQPAKTMVGSNLFIGGNYGNPGGSSGQGGGGGGAGAAGVYTGGAGIQININGTPTYYAGGGGGGGTCSSASGGVGGGGSGGYYWNGCLTIRDGGTNLGGGGGAGGSSGDVTGGAGGSGIVILNYPNTFGLAVSTTGSPSQTYYGANIVYKFTSSGTITF